MVQSEPHSYLTSLLQATHHSNAFSHSIYPVALATDQNQTIATAVPAAGLTQTPCPSEGNAAELAPSLKRK